MPTPPRVLPTHHLKSSYLGACTAPGAWSREYEAVIFLSEPLLCDSSGLATLPPVPVGCSNNPAGQTLRSASTTGPGELSALPQPALTAGLGQGPLSGLGLSLLIRETCGWGGHQTPFEDCYSRISSRGALGTNKLETFLHNSQCHWGDSRTEGAE